MKRELIGKRENENSRKDLSLHLGWSINGSEEVILLDCSFGSDRQGCNRKG